MSQLEARAGRLGRERRRLVFAFLFVTATASYFAVSAWQARPVVIDDAFISYRYAANLLAGHGLEFNPGERVEGYTNFFWVLLAVGALALKQDPFAYTVGLGVASFLMSLVLCSTIAFFSARGSWWQAVTASLALGLFVLPKGFAVLAGSGLETSFLGLVLLSMGALNHLWRVEGKLLTGLAACLPLIALLTRLDSALVVGASGIVFLGQARLERGSWGGAARATLFRFGPAFVGLLAFLVWKVSYYGSFVPNTYWAKGADFVPLIVGTRYVVGFIRHAPWVLFLAPLALYAALSAPRPLRGFARFGLLSCLLHAGYVAKVGGDFMQYRFMWEVVPLFLATTIIGLRELPQRAVAFAVALAALPLATTEPYYEYVHEMHEPQKMDDYTRSGIRVGKALARVPEDTIVATTLAGTVGYYSGLKVIDQWGLNDAYVSRLEVNGFSGRGHVKRAPQAYLESRGVNLFVDHPARCKCSMPCAENKPNVFLRIGEDECVRAWYLTQTEKLTRALCEPRQDVILHNVQCPGEPEIRDARAFPANLPTRIRGLVRQRK